MLPKIISSTIRSNTEIFILDEKVIVQLKKLALQDPLKRSRICLHEDNHSCVQEMIIVAHKNTLIEPHRHPLNKPESYHIIYGELLIKIFNDGGRVTKNISLSGDGPQKMYRIRGGVWHQPIPVSEWAVYHEVYTGPFIKEIDVIYSEW